ncbi:MAG: SDR family oxidoreductase [Gammaproteobacteria bacterium]|nr:SDR family oxidoreductase [Gammaproteobacteria bacterium]MCP4089523.1 SDR family oxidoreductase [Gammaproteobacteria bacterium]MCP4276229.1 SDR family oxidoreductase [Gammaproteobacteria bacterium]MCP4832926.1 SDR family oxidoreductase [Gammaproteobacteria bacterium]MCP4930051.1 SDR family oxidoreductase [Gammaproteobacteria bacterium]
MTTQTDKELLVFGATGGTGEAITRMALKKGYGVTVFVRDIKHTKHLFNDLCSQLTFMEGDALNPEDVNRSIGSNLHSVISALGIYHKLPGHDKLSQATKNILTAMNQASTNRFICISSIGVGDSYNQGDTATRLIQKSALRFTLSDKEKQEKAIRNSDLDWTLIRPSRLMNGNGPSACQTWSGPTPNKKLLWSVNRSQVATLVLDCLEDDTSIRQAINITGCPE